MLEREHDDPSTTQTPHPPPPQPHVFLSLLPVVISRSALVVFGLLLLYADPGVMSLNIAEAEVKRQEWNPYSNG